MGIVYSTIIGAAWSNEDDYDYDSDSESDSNENLTCSSTHALSDTSDNCMDSATDTLDATLLSTSSISLNLDQVLAIENQLDEYEKVSLVYLLYDDAQAALSVLATLLSDKREPQKKIIYNWARQQSQSTNKWQEKLVEALCIIQNYQILVGLGFNRSHLNARFLPHQLVTSEQVSGFRKALYFVCENLTQSEFDHFMSLSSSSNFKQFEASYLEQLFLQWESEGHIKRDNLNKLYTVLKQMEKFDLCDELKQIIPVVVPTTAFSATLVKDKPTPAACSKKSPVIYDAILRQTSLLDIVSLEESSIGVDNAPLVHDDKYFIDVAKPGVCLIINQENFYMEIDKQYKDLLPTHGSRLESRKGTAQDRRKLEATFKEFGFLVYVEENLTHTEMFMKIHEVVERVSNESSLFVCIMSHGERGVVYGVNSCQVSIDSIQRVMCSRNRKNLVGKPKVLILQSCQGTQCQKVTSPDDDDDNVMDSPSSTRNEQVPSTADLFTFWATVPGYGAIRNKKTGSWFIQSLCDQMKALGNKFHFVDICTAVLNDVTKMKWRQDDGEVAMVPRVDSTLRKFLFLPPIKTLK